MNKTNIHENIPFITAITNSYRKVYIADNKLTRLGSEIIISVKRLVKHFRT